MSEAILGVIAVLTLIASVIAAVFAYRDFKLGQRQELRDKEIPLAHPIVRWDMDRNAAVAENRGTGDALDIHVVIYKALGGGSPVDTGHISQSVLKANLGNSPEVEAETFREFSDATESIRGHRLSSTFRGEFTCHVHYRTPLGKPQVSVSQFTIPKPSKDT